MKIAISAIIIKENRILLIKRWNKVKLESWKWFVPWWKWEEWETPEQTIIRECREELNIDFTPIKIFQEIEDYWYKVYKILWEYSWSICLQEDEIDWYWWFTYSEAINLDLGFDLKDVLLDLKENNLLKI